MLYHELTVGIAVPVLGGWHVYLASRGESSIESHDNSYLEGKAKAEGLVRGTRVESSRY